MAKTQLVQYRVTQPFYDPYTGELYPEHKLLEKLPGWAKSDINAALVTGLLVEIITEKIVIEKESDDA